jgi:hypothetical protein
LPADVTDNERLFRVRTALTREDGSDPTPTWLCLACANLLSSDGTAIALMGIDGQPSAFYASGPQYERIEEDQFTAGIGPAPDAYASGVPVLADDLAASPTRWVGLSGSILAAGVQAVFSFPLQAGISSIGTLTWYRLRPGWLDPEQHADALIAAEVVAQTLLALQAGTPDELLAAILREEGSYKREVHQAAGMISVQLGVSVNIAVARLRAWAFANNLSVADAALRVVRGELRLEADDE